MGDISTRKKDQSLPEKSRRKSTLPLKMFGIFLVAFLILLGGIHQTASLTSRRHEDPTFGPPVVQRALRNTSELNVKKSENKVVKRRAFEKRGGQEEREAREAARAQQTQYVKDASVDDSLENVNITDKGDNVTVTDLRPKKFPHYPKVQYLGVLIDAGRHYFPIDWLKDTIDVLHRMKFNFIHFRLTDDQAFNIQLESHPELAKPSAVNNPGGKVYSIDELTDLIAYASEKNITIMPEINVPGHAGAWAGYPNFLVACPEFICLKGYGVPLNISHPQVLSTIRNVIGEVRDIFEDSPYLHLGGDEVEMSQACFKEANTPMFNYTEFEANLQQVLLDLNISVDNVLRWEMSPWGKAHTVNASVRAGKMMHYWAGHSYKKATPETEKPFFVSQGLYFDSNEGENGWSIYSTAKMQASLKNKPVAIIAGTFELSTETWVDRNVLGRLLAVAMGAAKLHFNTTDDFEKAFGKHCNSLGLDPRGCSSMGMPILHQKSYQDKWNKDWDVWKGDICERLTTEYVTPIMNRQDKIKQKTLEQASQEFWNSFGLDHPTHSVTKVSRDNAQTKVASLPALAVNHVGVAVDLVNVLGYLPEEAFGIMKNIIDDMHILGFNLLQLRIMNEFGMALKLHSLPNLYFLVNGTAIWTQETVRQIVQYAGGRGIQVMPEISITTRAGGWLNAGLLADCPSILCINPRDVAIDTQDSTAMQIFALVLRELRGLFSSDLLHFGYDERKEAMKCYHEANIADPKIDEWEQRLQAVLRLEGIPEENVLRWENTEGVLYPHRAGLVTNYRNVSSIQETTTPFYVSINVSDTSSAWELYERTRAISQAAPAGIMAMVESLEDWNSLHLSERLLTISMGARKMELKNKEKFVASFLEAYETLKLKKSDFFITSNTTTVPATDLATKQKLLTERLCEARTTKKVVKRARKGILVES